MLFLRYSGRSVNKDHVRYLKAHRKVGFFVVYVIFILIDIRDLSHGYGRILFRISRSKS